MNCFFKGFLAFLLVTVISSSFIRLRSPRRVFYMIVSPSVYYAGSTVQLEVNLFGSRSCNVVVKLASRRRRSTSIASGIFKPNEPKNLWLKVPFKNMQNPYIESKVCGGNIKRSYIVVKNPKKSIFIQTDKPIYKPGQKVHMRIIAMNSELKPAGNEVSSVAVTEASGSKIMQWNNVKLHDGIASLELQLSTEPVLGEWKIKADIQGSSETETIEVAKYVKPKFEVVITPPSYVATDRMNISCTICARYTYGKPVSGTLDAKLCIKHDLSSPDCYKITKEVTGCTEITLDRSDLPLKNVNHYRNPTLVIHASLKETLTGLTKRAKPTATCISERSVVLDFSDTPKHFKPGLPFKYKLKVTYPDGTALENGIKVFLLIKGAQSQLIKNTYTLKNGAIIGELKVVAVRAKHLHFSATIGHQFQNYTVYHVVRAWHSPSLSYLALYKVQEFPAKVNRNGSVLVRYNVYRNIGRHLKFNYNVMCKDSIVRSGIINRNHYDLQYSLAVKQFLLTFPVTQAMMPRCRILVYYVRSDKETVAGSIIFDIEDKLENQVSLRFKESAQRPGKKTKLILKAKPGSRVAFSAIDKSIYLLRSGNELTKDQILDVLRDLDGEAENKNDKCYYGTIDTTSKDASTAFDVAGTVFLSNLNVFTKKCRPPPRRWRWRWRYRPFRPPGLRRFFGGFFGAGHYGQPGPRGFNTRTRERELYTPKPTQPPPPTPRPTKRSKPRKIKIRRNFPETWLWADEKFNETSGIKTIEVEVPDSITTWVANGFAMSSRAGIGISEPASIKAFQPFFAQMVLPYSVIRGEEIPVTVTVFNYMSSCAPIKLKLNRKSQNYKVTSYNIRKLCVCGDTGKSVKFTIIPKNLGLIPVMVTAQTSSAKLCPTAPVAAADAITRKLLVEPEGIKREYTKGSFFCPKGGNYNETFDLNLPKVIVPGSVFARVSVVGDIMGPALSNLDGLLQMPYGCGEQNMAKFAPNIYIMDYLTKTGQVTKEIKDKAIWFMNSGYQRQLTYKRKSGSYSAFGNSDKKGSIMLTAFVVRTFARGERFIFVDEREIKHSFKWFESKQLQSGCFPNYGKVFNKNLQGGVSSKKTITAYVTASLLEAGQTTQSSMVSKALSCLATQVNSSDDTYTVALTSYALALAKHSKAAKMIKLLTSRATTKDDEQYWLARSAESPTQGKRIPFSWWYAPTPSADVETTGYALLALLKQDTSESLKNSKNIIRWLTKQRNSYGGFSSTQDTCVALQALAEFATMAFGDTSGGGSNKLLGSIKIKNYVHNFTVTENSRLYMQRVEIPGKLLPDKLRLAGEGSGCALVQTTVKYNIPAPEKVDAFHVNVNARRRRSVAGEEKTFCNPLRLVISAKWLKKDTSNMAVIDVKLVSGFTVVEQSLKLLENDHTIKFKRYDIEGQHVMLYFDEIKDLTISIDIHQNTLVKKMKPAVVRVYDYYDPENEGKVMYSIDEKACYGDQIQQLCPNCLSVKNIEMLVNESVNCSSYVSLVKSTQGLIKIGRGYGKTKIQKKYFFPYEIPEFCLCDELHDKVKSLVIGPTDYFKGTGNNTMLMLDSSTTILKWPKEFTMARKMKRKMREITKKCAGQ